MQTSILLSLQILLVLQYWRASSHPFFPFFLYLFFYLFTPTFTYICSPFFLFPFKRKRLLCFNCSMGIQTAYLPPLWGILQLVLNKNASSWCEGVGMGTAGNEWWTSFKQAGSTSKVGVPRKFPTALSFSPFQTCWSSSMQFPTTNDGAEPSLHQRVTIPNKMYGTCVYRFYTMVLLMLV